MSGTETGGALGDATGTGQNDGTQPGNDINDPNNPNPGSQQAGNTGSGGSEGAGGPG